MCGCVPARVEGCVCVSERPGVLCACVHTHVCGVPRVFALCACAGAPCGSGVQGFAATCSDRACKRTCVRGSQSGLEGAGGQAVDRCGWLCGPGAAEEPTPLCPSTGESGPRDLWGFLVPLPGPRA